MRILIINGPNLNLLGSREPDLYGTSSFDDLLKTFRKNHEKQGHQIGYFQSNHCGELIDKIQEAKRDFDALVINPAGYSHNSVALADAVKACKIPVVEVHITNIHARESFRHQSLISPYVQGVICGLGVKGYELALVSLLDS